MEEFKLTEKDMEQIIDSLDDTAGYLIKESTLRYWIEYYVNKERVKKGEKSWKKNRLILAMQKFIPRVMLLIKKLGNR